MIQRLVRLLDALPEHPKYVTTERLARVLGVSRRTVQRNLSNCRRVLPLRARPGQPMGWAWERGSKWRL